MINPLLLTFAILLVIVCLQVISVCSSINSFSETFEVSKIVSPSDYSHNLQIASEKLKVEIKQLETQKKTIEDQLKTLTETCSKPQITADGKLDYPDIKNSQDTYISQTQILKNINDQLKTLNEQSTQFNLALKSDIPSTDTSKKDAIKIQSTNPTSDLSSTQTQTQNPTSLPNPTINIQPDKSKSNSGINCWGCQLPKN